MHRLERIDTLLLDLESERCPTHTLKIAVIRPPAGAGFGEVRDSITTRIGRVPPFRWRLASPPGGIGRPAWVEDEGFDLDRHLRRVTATPPGGMRELCEVVSRAAEPPLLERDRPLWQAWIVNGLTDGRLAGIFRIHHALADGVSSARMLAAWFGAGEAREVPDAGAAPPPLRFAAETVRDGLRSAASDVPRLVKAARAAGRGKADTGEPVPGRPAAPATRLNGALSTRRAFACVELDLAEVMQVKSAAGTTVNDVFLSLVAGALRTELGQSGALPDEPLVAGVPVSRLSPELQRGWGNRGLTTMYARLPTDLPDPIERLREARAAALEAKGGAGANRGRSPR